MGCGRNYNPEGGFITNEWSFSGEIINNIKVIYNTQ